MCCFVILLLFSEMQMSVRRFSAIPHLRANLHGTIFAYDYRMRLFSARCLRQFCATVVRM